METIEKNVRELTYDEENYPRKFTGIDYNRVQELSEIITKLEPIKINQNNKIISGVHRWLAHKEAKQKTIQCIVIETKDDTDLLFKALVEDSKSAMPLSPKDKKGHAVEQIKKTLENKGTISGKRKLLAERMSITEDIINKWTKNIRDKYEEQIKQQIINEYLRGESTQQQIADRFDVSRTYVEKLKLEMTQIINLFFVSNPQEYFNELDKELQRKLLKEYRTEDEKEHSQIPSFDSFYKRLKKDYFELADFKPFLYNIWNIQSGDNKSHFGHFPQVFMENLLYYHTEPFDIIFDPFAGSGTTIDACKKWYRRYECYDLKVKPGREKDIIQHNIATGLPDIQKPDMAFLDPPYWKQSENQYSEDKEDLGNMTLEQFYKTIGTFLKLLSDWNIKKIAIVCSPTQYSNDRVFEHHLLFFDKYLDDKYKVNMTYSLPYSTQQYNGNQIEIMKKEKKAVVLTRELWIWHLKTG